MMAESIDTLIEGLRRRKLTRREFLHRAIVVTGSLAAATTLADAIAPAASDAALVDPNDPGLASSEVKYNATDGTVIGGYLTRPKSDGARPAVVVIHPWSGIDEHTRDVARRFAKAGYVALAPDLLSRQGGTSSYASREEAIAAGRKLTNDMIAQDLAATTSYLKTQNFVRAAKIGVIGFCWGGGKALMFTTRSKDLAATVVYYGESPDNLDDVKNINAPVLGNYGGDDPRITSGVPKLDEAMKQFGKSFEYKIYPGAPHSFNSDDNPRSYREEAAKEAWAKTLDFFKKHLQS
jgi:carboxymethylenebutenolidase